METEIQRNWWNFVTCDNYQKHNLEIFWMPYTTGEMKGYLRKRPFLSEAMSFWSSHRVTSMKYIDTIYRYAIKRQLLQRAIFGWKIQSKDIVQFEANRGLQLKKEKIVYQIYSILVFHSLIKCTKLWAYAIWLPWLASTRK